ncbi:NAD(P)H-binding protein [Flavihumibacter sp. UBA7668]|uniref:NAD(P)H-binding protein n=1 Tax=Flavihumibacter sp. UBA7668 TaxID=1946542 RepID=UPI0025C05F93|nr:NAD(P)H-binding protein [Flavihumibacter sp. UBA7668]
MNYVITGGAGHISKPLVLELLKKGHQVTVLGRSATNLQELVDAGAKAAIGSVEDRSFLTREFAGADAVYLMIPPIKQPENWKTEIGKIGENYAAALKETGVKYAVLLSSVGAHMPNGCGPVSGLFLAEQALDKVPGLNLLKLRPGYFYINFLGNIPMIKTAQIMGSNFGGTADKIILSSTDDIADAAAAALLKLNFKGSTVRYLVSDEKNTADIAAAIGKTIDQPELPWVPFTDEQLEQGLLAAGLAPQVAKNYTEMGTAIRSGQMFEEYRTSPDIQKGTRSFDTFLPQFKAVYTASK